MRRRSAERMEDNIDQHHRIETCLTVACCWFQQNGFSSSLASTIPKTSAIYPHSNKHSLYGLFCLICLLHIGLTIVRDVCLSIEVLSATRFLQQAIISLSTGSVPAVGVT